MIPFPVLELTMEQQFQLRKLADAATSATKEDLTKLLMQSQRQNFMYTNTITNLVKRWNEIDSQRVVADKEHSTSKEDV